eukprot:3863234-Alexandrium_andersonii.AAC.1
MQHQPGVSAFGFQNQVPGQPSALQPAVSALAVQTPQVQHVQPVPAPPTPPPAIMPVQLPAAPLQSAEGMYAVGPDGRISTPGMQRDVDDLRGLIAREMSRNPRFARDVEALSLIHISEPTRLALI